MNQSMTLNGKWKLYYGLEEGEMPAVLADVKARNWPAIEASVPGNVELDLVRAGVEDDPYIGLNLYQFSKYEYFQWWFEREFQLQDDFQGKDIVIKLHGLDTFGTIWVNDALAGTTDNMMIEHECDITRYVRFGETNHIAIRIESAMNKIRDKEFPVNLCMSERHDELVWLRKPAHSFGWDIAPRLLSAGIWRDIEIIAQEKTRLTDVYYATQQLHGNSAQMAVRYRFTTDKTYLNDFSIRIKGVSGEHSFEHEANTKFVSDGFSFDVPNPKLWWPKGYGDANLYEVTFVLLYKGQPIDSRTENIGIRVLELKTAFEPGDAGEFQIIANGIPIFAKGTNWVPLDALHSRDKERLQQAHDLLTDLGCNIVRCWGGNVYEDHEFFELCDRRGMMVWQDFAMACAIYPQNEEFADMIRKEAVSIVKKMRNHPSILLWAGDNEIDQLYYHKGYVLPHSRYNRISRDVLPNVVGSHDPFRNYLHSSPYIPDHIIGDLNVPEQHNWGPRDYFKGDFYKHTTAHFISEIGYHGCPAASSIKKFISPDQLWPYQNNDEWDTHNTEYIPFEKRYYNRNELMANQVEILFGHVPGTLEEFALASQISQAEAKKFFVEMVRLRKWRRTGVIWWNALDCWPQFSDAVVDYYFNKKLAYHYLRRVQAPVCLMMSEIENWHHRVILGNDSLETGLVSYHVEDGDTGEILLQGQVMMKANENVEVGSIRTMEGKKRLYLLKWKYNSIECANHYISGLVPFDLNQYKKWLTIIEALPEAFSSEKCYS
ncbi:glycoside hydrolase family 2 protein [Paenibacillus sp. OV219]|uniref:glycoside hydrolase family 2 protein n=1 Tax=Paenibacillus sp. OV219 TaxID=1884377 RepID=UPI0008B1798A|nr:sugar-binding domain-containing protein [Paenibacillus sp. OV219]SEN81000.1 beta-mannosidase [Paenibacillus sp. OV219]